MGEAGTSFDRDRVRLGYCTNVHAGHDLASTLENLDRHSAAVRRRLGGEEPLGIGLWLSADAARLAVERVAELRERTAALGLRVFTINGFPYGNFHEPVVKQRVYEPSWADPRRLAYTLELVRVLAGVIDAGEEGSISTLPIGWPGPECAPVDRGAAAANLRAAARAMARTRAETGRLIHLDLEPEPGCILNDSRDVVRFWAEHLLTGDDRADDAVHEHIRVCHDACHAAVVFEPQEDALGRYRAAGVRVGKVQISSAVRACFEEGEGGQARHAAVLGALRSFAEPRYLHQTSVRGGRPGAREEIRLFTDLPEALGEVPPAGAARGEWRVHFHVPIFMERVGELKTTRDQIVPCLGLALQAGVRHFEVETYAWGVLPAEQRPADLAAGIAEEMRFAQASLEAAMSATSGHGRREGGTGGPA